MVPGRRGADRGVRGRRRGRVGRARIAEPWPPPSASSPGCSSPARSTRTGWPTRPTPSPAAPRPSSGGRSSRTPVTARTASPRCAGRSCCASSPSARSWRTGPAVAFAAAVSAHTLGRGAAVAAMGVAPVAGAEGLGADYARSVGPARATVGALVAVAVVAVATGWWVAPLAATAAVGAAAVVAGRPTGLRRPHRRPPRRHRTGRRGRRPRGRDAPRRPRHPLVVTAFVRWPAVPARPANKRDDQVFAAAAGEAVEASAPSTR